MLRSPAYCALSLSARRILDRLEIELADHGGADNGKLPVTYQDFVDYGLHRQAIYPAIREVVALGFVEITEEGVAGGPEYRKPNKFRITYRHSHGLRGDGTHEWMKISEEDAPMIATAARLERAPQKQNLRYGNRQESVRKPYRKRGFSSTETDTTACSTETVTTLDISSVKQHDKAREARSSESAVASGPLSRERPEVIQNRIAQRIGRDGWTRLGELAPPDLATLTDMEAAGTLDAARLAKIISAKKENAA